MKKLELKLRQFISPMQISREDIVVLLGKVNCKRTLVEESPHEDIYNVVCIPETKKAMVAKVSCSKIEGEEEVCYVDLYRYDEEIGWEFLDEFGV